MHAPFQKTLYRSENSTWHYLRLLWREDSKSFEVSTASCGQVATSIRQEALLPGETKETALHRLAVALKQAGYSERPDMEWYLDLQIFTPPWDGPATAAPWFDALQSDILQPLYEVLEETANGGYRNGVGTETDCITHFLWVLDPEAAMKAIETIAMKTPALCRIQVNYRKKPEEPVPEKLPALAGIITDSLETAETPFPIKLPAQPGTTLDIQGIAQHLLNLTSGIAEEIKQAIRPYMQTQPVTYPDSLGVWSAHAATNRVLGEKAKRLRDRLETQWGIGKGCWPPLGGPAPCETLHVIGEGLEDETGAKLNAVIQSRMIGQMYAFDERGDIFITDAAENLFFRYEVWDTFRFDDGMEWIVYITHENTVTFGGEWLLDAVRELFKDQPERLNPWF